MKIEEFLWEECKSGAPGYPIEVYRGGLHRPNGEFTSLWGGLSTGKHGWGAIGSGWSNGVKSLPNSLHVKWVSFAEDCVYEIETPIDYDKMLRLFKKGFYTPSTDPQRPPFKQEFYKICVGFAPGGVVVVWISGGTRQIEIGRYQGHKIRVSEEEIAQLDPPEQIMFTKEERERVMTFVNIIPQEIQDAHKGKPIPFGRWDSIRKRYTWRIQLELPNNIKDKEAAIFYYNGEMEDLFGKVHTEQFEIEDYLKIETSLKKAIPKSITLRWFDSEKDLRVCNIKFNEEEIFKAFSEVFKDNEEGEAILNIRVNEIETNAAIQLRGNNKEIWLPNTRVIVFDK